jgi:enoyl-CoA hydratase/carnithine racemase
MQYYELLWGSSGLFQRYMQLHKMTILAAKCRCFDVGLYLALTSDIVVGADNLQIGNPRWLFGGADGDLSLLTAAVGLKRAKQLVFVDNVITADIAKEIKLVELVVPGERLGETVMALATTLTGIPRDNIFTGKDRNGAHFFPGMSQALGRAAGLSNILIREGEFNFLRERRNRGLEGALQAAAHYAKGEPID